MTRGKGGGEAGGAGRVISTTFHLYTKEGDGVSWETGTNTHTLSALYIKETTNENLLQSTGTSAQRPVVTRMGRRSEGKGYMRVDGKEVRGEGVYVRGWKGSRRGRDICAWMGRRSEGKGYMRVAPASASGLPKPRSASVIHRKGSQNSEKWLYSQGCLITAKTHQLKSTNSRGTGAKSRKAGNQGRQLCVPS